jgi:hypothetical protein
MIELIIIAIIILGISWFVFINDDGALAKQLGKFFGGPGEEIPDTEDTEENTEENTPEIPNAGENTGTGWYGTFNVTNIPGGRNNPLSFRAKLAFNETDITQWIIIPSGETRALTVPIEKRLPTPGSKLELKIRFEPGTIGVNLSPPDYTQWVPDVVTDLPLTEINTVVLSPKSSSLTIGINVIT